jgi:hypothetical protein
MSIRNIACQSGGVGGEPRDVINILYCVHVQELHNFATFLSCATSAWQTSLGSLGFSCLFKAFLEIFLQMPRVNVVMFISRGLPMIRQITRIGNSQGLILDKAIFDGPFLIDLFKMATTYAIAISHRHLFFDENKRCVMVVP